MKRRYRQTEGLLSHFPAQRDAIRARLADFAAIRPEEYFYELVYCLLTPQSSAVNAGRATNALKQAGLLEETINPAPILNSKAAYIRFHNTKSRSILEAKEQFGVILSELQNGATPSEMRDWLVKNVRGLGLKEASHFLRNIGRQNLAILDRHILRNLVKHGVIRHIPKTLTKKRYLGIEKRFRLFAKHLGLTMDELDLYFWSLETGEILK
jgi:N-glycosylase/DNA lyase